MKNTQHRLLLLILVLLAGSIYVVATRPTRMGLDIQGGMRVVLRAQIEKLPKGVTWSSDKLETVANIIHHRVDSLGVAEPLVTTKPSENQIVVELPGVLNREEARRQVSSTAKLEFRWVPELADRTWITRDVSESGSDAESGTRYQEIINAATGKPVSPEELQDRVFSKDPVLAGDKLKPNSRADLTNGVVIHFEFQDDAKSIFEEFTRSHIGKPLAIFLDEKLLSAPNIDEVIPGTGIIRGNFTPKSAKALADQLNAGALPVPLAEEQVVNVEATLGKQAVKQTMIAGIVGLGLVLLIMLWWYRMPGVLANLSLLLYALFTFALFKLIPVTLTVPGIAGFILSIGMAVDANILIFERMKEERLSGKSIRAAIETGFKRAFSAILDSNVCTLITCWILYTFGTGQVKGFALTLAVGVAVSMFTAITCTRTFLLLVAGTQSGQNDALYNLHSGMHPRLNVSKKMGLWFAISGIIILPGLIFWAMGGIKKSIEFTGGTEITAQFTKPVTQAQVEQAVQAGGQKEFRVVMAQDNRTFITTRVMNDAQRNSVIASLQNVAPFAKETVTNTLKQTEVRDVLSFSNVSGTISKELAWNAVMAVFFASVLIVLFLAVRFSIPNFLEGLKFGACAVAALLHDVGVLWGAFAILGFVLNWQIDSLFVTAMLTVIGFSVHDTIIIFDRLRENLHHRQRGESFAEVADRSIEQTFARSIRTSGTVVITLLALLFLGGPVVRLFVVALLIGIVSGTYSSIFNATPLLMLWKRRAGEGAFATAGAAPARPAPRPVARPTAKPAARPATRPQPAVDGPAVTGPAGLGISAGETDGGQSLEDTRAGRVQPKKRKRRM